LQFPAKAGDISGSGRQHISVTGLIRTDTQWRRLEGSLRPIHAGSGGVPAARPARIRRLGTAATVPTSGNRAVKHRAPQRGGLCL